MKNEIKYALYLVGLGVSLIAYAHATFSTKETTKTIKDDATAIREDIREIRNDIKTILREMPRAVAP